MSTNIDTDALENCAPRSRSQLAQDLPKSRRFFQIQQVSLQKLSAIMFVFLLTLHKPLIYRSFFIMSLYLSILIESVTINNKHAFRVFPMLGLLVELLIYQPRNLIVFFVSSLLFSLLYIKATTAYTFLDAYTEIVYVFAALLIFISRSILMKIVFHFSAYTLSAGGIYSTYLSIKFIQMLCLALYGNIVYKYIYNTLQIFGFSYILNVVNILSAGVFVRISYSVYNILYIDYVNISNKLLFFRSSLL